MSVILLALLGIVAIEKVLEFILKFLSMALGHKRLRLENETLKSRLGAAERAIDLYKARLNNPFLNPNRNISKDEIDAIKYAMKHSHSDNGGDAEDFKRFRKVYEELTGRRGKRKYL